MKKLLGRIMVYFTYSVVAIYSPETFVTSLLIALSEYNFIKNF